jgi:Zn-dependent protease
MAYGGYGGGSGGSSGQPRRRFQPDQRTMIIVVVAVALIAILLRTHKISSANIIYFCVLIPSIILHEISHGVVALAFGDDTAKRAGRLTLNPVKHVDPVGTLLVPAVLSLSGIGAYGWAKPVPVSPNRLRSPRNHTVLVSLIGPVTNFALAAILGLVLVWTTPQIELHYIAQYWSGGYGLQYPTALLGEILFIAGIANIVLGVFNCIPCPPLDGAAVLERFLPARMLPQYYNLQPFLMFLPLILILLFRNQWSEFITHIISWWAGLLG